MTNFLIFSTIMIGINIQTFGGTLDLTVPELSPTPPPWFFLFNHAEQTPKNQDVMIDTRALTKNSAKAQILLKLGEFLDNEVQPDGHDQFVDQVESDELLQMVVDGQLKSGDLMSLIGQYDTGANFNFKSNVQFKCSEDPKCQDGHDVLFSFFQVQNQIEALETGRLELAGLTPEQFSMISLNKILCFYYRFSNAAGAEQFRRKQFKELKAALSDEPGKIPKASDRALFRITSVGRNSSTLLEKLKPKFTDEQITGLIGTPGERLVVARCMQRESLLTWKQSMSFITH
jgi:hypothetical protein